MYDRILGPTDGSPEADVAARRGLNPTLEYEAQVHRLSDVDTNPYVGVLDESDVPTELFVSTRKLVE